MAQATFDIPSYIPATVVRPLYAGVGATDRVVEVFRGAVADVQQRALALQKSVATFDYEPQALRQQATQVVSAGVAGLRAEAVGLPLRLQRIADDQVANAGTTYDELVKRGETLVDRIRRQPSTEATVKAARTTTAKARTTSTQATKTASAAKKSASRSARTTAKKAAKSPARSSAKATSTAAKTTAAQATQAASEAAKKVGD